MRAVILLLVACHHVRPVSLAPLPRDVYVHYLDGKLALYRGDAEAAVAELTLAQTAAPEQPMIAVELAHALVRAKRAKDARDVLAKARKDWPDHPQVWLASGDVLAQEAPKDAARAYRRAIELAPDDERGYLGLAKIADARGAERTLRDLVRHVPTSVDGHYRLAQRVAIRGDLPGAINELRAVLERDPDHIDARLDLARALRRTGKLAEAIDQTRSAFDRAGQPMDVAEELFWLLCEADDRQAAIDLLTLLDDERSDVEMLSLVARLEIGLGRLDEAAAIARHVAHQDPDAAALIGAQIASARRDPVAAAKLARSIAKDSRVARDIQRVAAEAAIYAGDPTSALALAPDGTIEAAFALADLGRADEARTAAGKLEPFNRARFADHVHDTPGAVVVLEQILHGKPEHVAALNLAGYLLADARLRLPDAETYLRTARELSPGDPAILDSWGWLLFREGRVREAIRVLDHASRFAPLEPEILVHLAAAWAADHQPKTAAELLARADALHPSAEVARKIAAVRATMPP